MIIALWALPLLAVLLRPSPFDAAALIGVWAVTAALFRRPTLPLDLARSLMSEPARRARGAFWRSLVRHLPSLLWMLYVWRTPHAHLALFWLTHVAIAEGAVSYYASHAHISSLLGEHHLRQVWVDELGCANQAQAEASFARHEVASLLVLFLLTLFEQVAFLRSWRSGDPSGHVVAIGVAGAFALGHVWYVCNGLQNRALVDIFRTFENFAPGADPEPLAPHTAPLIARFERTYDALTVRLRDHERELSHFVSVRTEEQRLQALAEISALVVHDLSSPLQAVMLAADQLSSDRPRLQNPDTLDAVVLHGSRAFELVEGLRTYLRSPPVGNAAASLGEVLGYIMRMLETRFSEAGFSRIQCTVDDRLHALTLAASRADLIHILVNVLANAIQNMLDASIADPRLEISLAESSETSATISIADNGSGLSPERFEQLTGFAMLLPQGTGTQSLGLRLVRRLVERQGGRLIVVPRDGACPGTTFHLTIRIAPRM